MKQRKSSLLYIGNLLGNSKSRTVTTIDTLSVALRREGFDVWTASSKSNKVLRMLDMLWQVITKSRKVSCVLIDTYSTQNFYFAVAVANLCRLLRLPYIPILHGGNLPERLESNPHNSRKLFHGARVIVSPSAYLIDAFEKKGFHNLRYIPNTVELDKYPFLLRKEIKPTLLWVRSFAEIYNPMLALEVLKELRETHPEAHLKMIGPDKDGSLEACKKFAETHELPVTFTGKLTKSEWIELSRDCDVFLNTTNFDNMPVSVVEAMALGLPVISTRVGGMPFLIEDGKDGILVQPGDAGGFSDAIKTLISNPERANILAQNARKKVESFDWEKVKQLWLSLLRQ